MKKWMLIGCFCISAFWCKGQTYTRGEIDLTNFIEQNFQLQDLDLNYEDLYESLFVFYTNPINLNNTNRDEMIALYMLDQEQIENFFNYLEKKRKVAHHL